jgi:anti-sigma B factor antagonist
MEAREHVEDGLHIVALSGEIDLHRSPELRTLLDAHAKAKRPALLLDFSAVDYIDSSGLATLIEYVQKAYKFRGQFALGGVNERLRTIFDLARLGEVFPIHASLTEARAVLVPGK